MLIHAERAPHLGLDMKTSARNHFPGKIVDVQKGAVGAIVKLQIDSPVLVTAFITMESVADLKLKKGDNAVAIIKSTEVMIGKED